MLDYVDGNEFREFLILAKKSTYAGDGGRSKSKCILSKNYLFEKDKFRYEDQYFGEYLDVGEEIVWYDSVPIWGMGYRGGMLDDYRKDLAVRKPTFNFLSRALLRSCDDFPARGPEILEESGLKYLNKYQGNLYDFVGREEIFYENNLVYKRDYVGGLIYGKSNPNMIISSELS